jgi:hypothetical protein
MIVVLGRTLRVTGIAVMLVLSACSDGRSQGSTPPSTEAELVTPSGAAHPDDTCSPEAVRSTVAAFLQEAQASPDEAVERYIAPDPLFEWFSTEDRLDSDARDRGTLAEFLDARYAEAGASDLEHFQHNGRSRGVAHFEFRIRRSEGDTSTVFPGKGALDCGTGTIVVWSEGTPSN